MSKAAKTEDMEVLHALVARVLSEQLKGDEVTPAMLSTAIKFLKDNGIEAAKGSNNKALNDLASRVGRLAEGDGEELADFLN